MIQSKSTHRRAWLKGVGVVTVLAAGGTVWRMVDQGVFATGQGPAYEPWTTWRADSAQGSLSLVHAAVLAANPHNTQPWRFRVTESRIDLFADVSRNIGAIDPFLREMYVGLGCALENLLLAADAMGYRHQLTLLPNAADPAHAATIELSQGTPTASELYRAIARRHTDRSAYHTSRPLEPKLLQSIQALGKDFPKVGVFWFTSDERRARIGNWMIQATQAVIADEQQSRDSARWERMNWQALEQHRDGITMDATGLSPLVRAAAKVLPPLSQEQNSKAWLQHTKDTVLTGSNGFGIIAVRSNRDKSQRMMGGRLWQRIHLWGTLQGLGLQPLNQMSERADREQQLGITPVFGNALKELIGDPNWQGLMPFRIGYAQEQALASPRRALKDVLM